ncbi:unnamed protein product [Chrysoparadoxa australica]
MSSAEATAEELMLPMDQQSCHYCGYVTSGLNTSQQYRISIQRTEPGGPFNLDTIRCDPYLAELLQREGVSEMLRSRLACISSLEKFMTEIKDVLTLSTRSSSAASLPPAHYYSRLVAEINSVGWDCLAGMDEKLSSLQLKASDAKGRSHMVTVNMPADYPQGPPVCTVDLPLPLHIRWVRGQSSLADVYAQFKAALPRFLPLWEVLDDLDSHTCVLEPEVSSRGCCYRRIAVVAHCSITVHLSHDAPRALPELRFLGADSVIAPIQQRLSKNLKRWDQKLMVRENLEAILELELPSPSHTSREDFSADCGICYSYKLANGETPDRVTLGGIGAVALKPIATAPASAATSFVFRFISILLQPDLGYALHLHLPFNC